MQPGETGDTTTEHRLRRPFAFFLINIGFYFSVLWHLPRLSHKTHEFFLDLNLSSSLYWPPQQYITNTAGSPSGHSGSDLSIFPRPGSTTSASPLSSSPRPLVRSLAVVHLVTPSFAPSSVFCCYHSSHSASLTILRLGIVINKREQVSHATLCWSRFFAIIACRDWAEQALGICKSCRRLAAIRPHSSHDTDSRLNVVKPALVCV